MLRGFCFSTGEVVEKGGDVAEGTKRAEGDADHVPRQESKKSGDGLHHTHNHPTRPAEDPLALR